MYMYVYSLAKTNNDPLLCEMVHVDGQLDCNVLAVILVMTTIQSLLDVVMQSWPFHFCPSLGQLCPIFSTVCIV